MSLVRYILKSLTAKVPVKLSLLLKPLTPVWIMPPFSKSIKYVAGEVPAALAWAKPPTWVNCVGINGFVPFVPPTPPLPVTEESLTHCL